MANKTMFKRTKKKSPEAGLSLAKNDDRVSTAGLNPEEIKLIIGLGNPGRRYTNTYHNVGFLTLEGLARRFSADKFRRLKSKQFSFFRNGGGIFIMPSVFMNRSGTAVKEAMRYFTVRPEEVVIIHDDSDIELGRFKVSFGRGGAGHKGAQSVISGLKTKDFWRIRIGIRPTPSSGEKHGTGKRKRAEALVLKKISENNRKVLNKVFDDVATLLRPSQK